MSVFRCGQCARELTAPGVFCEECGEGPNIVVDRATPSPAVSARPSLTLVAPPINHPAEGVLFMSEPVAPAVSPTGAPVVPSWFPAVAAGLVSVAYTIQQIAPPHTIGYQIAGFVVAAGAIFGIVSPGMRKKT